MFQHHNFRLLVLLAFTAANSIHLRTTDYLLRLSDTDTNREHLPIADIAKRESIHMWERGNQQSHIGWQVHVCTPNKLYHFPFNTSSSQRSTISLSPHLLSCLVQGSNYGPWPVTISFSYVCFSSTFTTTIFLAPRAISDRNIPRHFCTEKYNLKMEGGGGRSITWVVHNKWELFIYCQNWCCHYQNTVLSTLWSSMCPFSLSYVSSFTVAHRWQYVLTSVQHSYPCELQTWCR
jgi:hypothetical protein